MGRDGGTIGRCRIALDDMGLLFMYPVYHYPVYYPVYKVEFLTFQMKSMGG